jgi:hypothetical protein
MTKAISSILGLRDIVLESKTEGTKYFSVVLASFSFSYEDYRKDY